MKPHQTLLFARVRTRSFALNRGAPDCTCTRARASLGRMADTDTTPAAAPGRARATGKRRRSKAIRTRGLLALVPPVPADARIIVPGPTDMGSQGAPADGRGEAGTDGRLAERCEVAPGPRRAMVWRLRLEGWDTAAIADRVGVAESTVREDLRIVARDAADRARGHADAARMLELARLDELWRAWYAQGCTLVDVYAAPILLRIVELRARLLRLDTLPADVTAADRPFAGLSDDDLRARLQGASADPGVAD